MNSRTYPDELRIGEWRVLPSEGSLERAGEVRRLEPKVMDLLLLLLSEPGEVFSRDRIQATLWPEVVVGDDALARCVLKLRRALEDNAQSAKYVETIPKRGYRLRADVTGSPVSVGKIFAHHLLLIAVPSLLVAAALLLTLPNFLEPENDVARRNPLVEQGLEYYSRYTRRDNESAIELFERALAENPDDPAALSGLANALSQRALRWPNESAAPPPQHSTLTNALDEGRLSLPNAQLNLSAARAFAERSVRVAPQSPASFKALGLVLSAQGDVDAAIRSYERALELDSGAWEAMINLAELYDYTGDTERGLAMLEQTYSLQPDYANLGVLIAARYQQANRLQDAALQYRQVLSYAPFHRDATRGLAEVLVKTGEPAEAARLCEKLIERTGPFAPCEAFLQPQSRQPSVDNAATIFYKCRNYLYRCRKCRNRTATEWTPHSAICSTRSCRFSGSSRNPARHRSSRRWRTTVANSH